MVYRKSVLMSIKPNFASLILSGVKKVELRRSSPKVSPGDLMVLYASSPVRAIVGCCRIRECIQAPPPAIWQRFQDEIGINEEAFWNYYESAKNGTALILEDIILFEPMPLEKVRSTWPDFTPPQSFRYLQTKLDSGGINLRLGSYSDDVVLTFEECALA